MCIVCGRPEGFEYKFKFGSFSVCDACLPLFTKALRDRNSIELDSRKIYRISNTDGWAIVEVIGNETIHHRYGYGDRVRIRVLVIAREQGFHWIGWRYSSESFSHDHTTGSIAHSKFIRLHPVEVPISDLPMYISEPIKTKYYDDILKGLS